jgi:hypothetical protein
VARNGINRILETISNQGGMSMSNEYALLFDFSNLQNETGGQGLLQRFDAVGIPNFQANQAAEWGAAAAVIPMFCKDAQLPNISANLSQLQGRYLGEGQVNYPTNKTFSDISLTWYCDANMAPHKFLTSWFDFIFPEYINGQQELGVQTISEIGDEQSFGSASPRPINRGTKVRYPVEYQCNIKIAKTENGPSPKNRRTSLVYVLENAFPTAIDAVPLSFGASQVTEVSASFSYSRHNIVYGDANYGSSFDLGGAFSQFANFFS